MTVLDFSGTPPRVYPAEVVGVVRYIAPRRAGGSRRPKCITETELHDHQKAGRAVGFVFEDDAGNSLKGAPQGELDGRIAATEMLGLGAPPGTCCYAAVDRDITVAQLAVVAGYLDAFHKAVVTAGYRRGVYGEYDVVTTMLRDHHVDLAWQTRAWSGGKRAHGTPGVVLYQNGQQIVVDGTSCDVNDVWADDWGQWRAKTVHIEDVLLYMIAQRGDRYVFGTEASPLDPNPTEFDCSELVEWACARAGVEPRVPDGAFNQWRHTKPLAMPVADALNTRGAVLFHGSGVGTGRDAISHVAMSIGGHQTIEARGSQYGVGTWSGDGRFQFAARIPGVDYSPRQQLPATSNPPVSQPIVTTYPEALVKSIDIQIDTDAQGKGYRDLPDVPARTVVNVMANTGNPTAGGYKPIPDVARIALGNGCRVVVEEAIPNGRIDVTVWVAA